MTADILYQRARQHVWVYVTVIGACLALLGSGLYFTIRDWKVCKSESTQIFRNENGSAGVRWTLPDGSSHSSAHPYPDHSDAIMNKSPEFVWYNPSAPDTVVYYGLVWPVPYTGLIMIAIAVPLLTAFLTAALKP